MVNVKEFSLLNKSLRHKLRVAFYLMSLIPLITCITLFIIYYNNISVNAWSFWEMFISISVSFIIAILGFLVAKQIVDPIIEINAEVKSITRGDLNRRLSFDREDEIGDLSSSLNQLVERIRNNMDELRNYGEKTKQINYEINRRVVLLSGLLEISNLITKGTSLREIFDISIGKLSELQDASWGCIVLQNEDKTFRIEASYGLDEHTVEDLKHDLGLKVMDYVLLNKQGVIINKDYSEKEVVVLRERFGTDNIMLCPIFEHGRIIGFVGVGSLQKEATFAKEDLEIVLIFAKQIAIALENEYLINRLQKLEIKDTLTGLYNKNFIINRLQEEIRRAIIYQRPCSFVLLSIDKFKDFSSTYGVLATEAALKKIATILESGITDIDRVARYGDFEFAIVLPDKNKKHSVNFANQLRVKVAEYFSQEDDAKKRLTICGAVSENPIDGSNAKDLISKAENFLNIARQKENTIIDKL